MSSTTNTEPWICARCDWKVIETPIHKYYQCPDNTNINSAAVYKSNYLIPKIANPHSMDQPCKVFRGILPASATTPSAGWLDEELAKPDIRANFSALLNKNKQCGTDGSGGPESNPRRRLAASAAAVYDIVTKAFSFLISKVPGIQTVPRAELWAICHILGIIILHLNQFTTFTLMPSMLLMVECAKVINT